MSPALAGRFLTTGLPEKSQSWRFLIVEGTLDLTFRASLYCRHHKPHFIGEEHEAQRLTAGLNLDVECNLPKLAKQFLLIHCSMLLAQNCVLAMVGTVLGGGSLRPCLLRWGRKTEKRGTPPPPHSLSTRQRPLPQSLQGSYFLMAGKDPNSELKAKTHSIFFTIPSALEEGGMSARGAFKLSGTEVGPFHGSSSVLEALGAQCYY